jgi:uncharacterized protein YdcH (DUF465 family)
MNPKYFRLLQKHQRLDDELRLEQIRRWPDATRIRQIKKLKLAVKDAMTSFFSSRGRRSAISS